MTGDPTTGYSLNIPYFLGFLTTQNTGGVATATNGILNVPPGIQVPANSLPGQVLQIGASGTNIIAGSSGLSDSAASPVGIAYAPSCGTSDLGDRSHITVITAAITVTIPPVSTNVACKNAVFYFLMRAAGTLTASGGDTFDIYNGSTALTGQTSYTASTGSYVSVINGSGSNWHLLVESGASAIGSFNEQEHYFAPDFALNVATTATSTGQGINPITAVTTPQLRIFYYFNIDSPLANTKIQAYIYRTTGTIPAIGSAPGTGDVRVMIVTFDYTTASALNALGGGIIDTTGAVTGTAYRYYLAFDSATAQSINIHSQSYIQVAESH